MSALVAMIAVFASLCGAGLCLRREGGEEGLFHFWGVVLVTAGPPLAFVAGKWL